MFWLLAMLVLPILGSAAEHGPQRPAAVSVYEDRSARLGIDGVLALPEAAFESVPERRLSREYTHSAFWLRVTPDVTQGLHLQRWLSVGDPRLSNIQVYVPGANRWEPMVAGIAHSPEQWPLLARQPLFPVDAQSDAGLLIRVTGKSLLVIEPLFWSDQSLLERRQRTAMADGLTLGIVMLVVPLSLVIGVIMRSPLLVAHATTMLCYILLTCVVNGYLVYWPSLLPWTAHVRLVIGLASFSTFLIYICLLLNVRGLPKVWAWIYSATFAVFVVTSLWGLFVDHALGRQATEWVMRIAIYLLLPVTLLASWRRGLSLIWMAWAVPILYLVQFLARYVFQADQIPWQARQDFLSLSSTLPGVAVLVCTLITELYLSRARQRWAQSERGQRRLAAQARLEETVARRTEQLRASLDARAALLKRVSQDLRGPLLDIVASARRLASESAGEYPRRIERNAERQLALVDELGDMAHQDASPIANPTAGSLNAFVQELTEEAELLAARQQNRFECSVGPEVPDHVWADFGRLRRVLINLLGNATKFTHQGRVALHVDCLALDVRAARLQFTVDDSGIGIHPGDRENLLQPFVRGRNVERFEGFGLGLDIVRHLLDSMDSALELADDNQPGSRFRFEVQLKLVNNQGVEPREAGR